MHHSPFVFFVPFVVSPSVVQNKKASRLPERNLKASNATLSPSSSFLAKEQEQLTVVHTGECKKKRLLALPLFRRPSHPEYISKGSGTNLPKEFPEFSGRNYSGATASDFHRLPYSFTQHSFLQRTGCKLAK
jgi:hypothetical protein